jgi:hypothetical protein
MFRFAMVALAVPISGTAIEALFRPSTKCLPDSRTQVELLQDLAPEDVLATGITWEDFRRFLHGRIFWMAFGVFICSSEKILHQDDILDLSLGACIFQGSQPACLCNTGCGCCSGDCYL